MPYGWLNAAYSGHFFYKSRDLALLPGDNESEGNMPRRQNTEPVGYLIVAEEARRLGEFAVAAELYEIVAKLPNEAGKSHDKKQSNFLAIDAWFKHEVVSEPPLNMWEAGYNLPHRLRGHFNLMHQLWTLNAQAPQRRQSGFIKMNGLSYVWQAALWQILLGADISTFPDFPEWNRQVMDIQTAPHWAAVAGLMADTLQGDRMPNPRNALSVCGASKRYGYGDAWGACHLVMAYLADKQMEDPARALSTLRPLLDKGTAILQNHLSSRLGLLVAHRLRHCVR